MLTLYIDSSATPPDIQGPLKVTVPSLVRSGLTIFISAHVTGMPLANLTIYVIPASQGNEKLHMQQVICPVRLDENPRLRLLVEKALAVQREGCYRVVVEVTCERLDALEDEPIYIKGEGELFMVAE